MLFIVTLAHATHNHHSKVAVSRIVQADNFTSPRQYREHLEEKFRKELAASLDLEFQKKWASFLSPDPSLKIGIDVQHYVPVVAQEDEMISLAIETIEKEIAPSNHAGSTEEYLLDTWHVS